jgi:recombination protein RecT
MGFELFFIGCRRISRHPTKASEAMTMSTPAPSPSPAPNNNAARAVAAGTPNPSQAVAVAQTSTPLAEFICGLDTRIDRLRVFLPEDVDLRRFVDTAKQAVAGNPFLLKCDQRSLFNAIVRAARDRLQPDGREGALVPHDTSVNVDGKWTKTWTVRWNPMVYGLRRRFMEAGQLLLDAQVVYSNDQFDYALGDEPFIAHVPPDVRKRQPRGELCAAYCIVRRASDGKVVHREVMTGEEIDRIRKMVESKMKEGKQSPLWSKHTAEAYKKTVVHRLAKTVPLCAELADIFARENEDIDWGAEIEAAAQEQRPAPTSNPLRDPDLDLLTDDDVIDVDAGTPESNAKAEPMENENVSA